MCIYCATKNYRRIYEHHYGKIPVDSDGRKYEIHHIDGNHNNNHPENLIAVTIQEHFTIHESQGDWAACLIMAERMKIDPVKKSELARQNALRQMENNTNALMKFNLIQGKGLDNKNTDKKIYCFEHKKTKIRIYSTRYEFYTKYNLPPHTLTELIQGKHRTLKGWTLITIDSNGNEINSDKQNKLKDHTIYQFKNRKTNEIVNMTRSELSNTYNLDHRALSTLVKGKRNKTRVGDWILIRPD